MAGSLGPAGDLNQDINVLPLIDVLLVLIIVFFLMAQQITFIPAAIPAAETAQSGTQPVPAIVLELRADGSYAINSQPIPIEQLDTQLHAIYDERPRKVLFLKVADNRLYDEVVTAMDMAREAGVQVLGWVPQPKPELQRP